jgi:endoglucanase
VAFRSLCVGASILLLAACGSGTGLTLAGDAGAGDALADVVRADAQPGTKTPPIEGVLIDDFEDGDGQAVFLPGGWYSYDDWSNGGGSSISYTGSVNGGAVMNGPGYQSERSLEVTYTFDQGTLPYQPYVGWGVWFADQSAPLDASQFVGIAYTYRGSAHRVRVENFEVADFDFFGMDMGASADWKTVIVPFAQLSQNGWGAKVAFNPASLGNISFEARGNTGQAGKVDIDDLMFLTRLPDQPPDMTIMPPSPPAEVPITSITITHPGQARARAYLDRGYNLSDWLEADRFAGFTYDGAYVAKLAAAGFKSLRLPIDLDLYVLAASGTGDATDVVVQDDLWTVLDAFEQWTAAVGMSLTIDYHEYDDSLNLASPASIDQAVALWRTVAAHFAGNARPDLFYELLNEPELSFGGSDPTQAEWTAVATRMIAAIRTSDTFHSILFGDVNYYGIAQLVSREPLADDNVIYIFHDYEPFIFTHQGASWASMASTHDIPYPYSAERWSEYYGDLGFNSSMPSWILAAAQGYYQTGNRAAVRNQMVQAKRWAVGHNVPVICNEFGAYDRTSRLEDRARYLADVVSIFEELEIPWQEWFLVMDSSGAVLPEYAAAMHLGQ